MTKASDTANILKQPFTNTLGTSNYRAGVNAGDTIASGGNYNVTIGDEAGTALTTGDGVVAIGFEALKTEDANGTTTAIGYQALKVQNAGAESNNTAVGYQAGLATNTGVFSTFIGSKAGTANTTGQNTFVGGQAGQGNTDGTNNLGIGVNALQSNTTGDFSVAIGHFALQTQNITNGAAGYNTAVGHNAGNDITTGTNNTIIGANAGDAMTTGASNTFVGISAGGVGVVTGNNNVGVGNSAGNNITSGASNTCIGNDSGLALTTGGQNSCIGHEANAASSGANNSFTLGNGDITTLRCNDTSISSLSDERDKTNIQDLPTEAGLVLINALRPVTFHWDRRDWYEDGKSDGSKIKTDFDKDVANSGLRQGFIAQEVAAAVKGIKALEDDKIVLDDNADKFEFAPAKLITNLVKAVQELSAKVKALEDG